MPTLSIDNQVQPRIISVDAPDVQITVQELLDLLRDWEDETPQADDLQIISAAGKEALGGSVFVGVTATLLDAQLSFEARTAELEQGTETTGGSSIVLTDTTATFQTNLVGRGDLIINESDSSQATVVSVQSETSLTTTALLGGAGNDYGIGDAYSIYDVVQCNISGGNLVAVDDVGADIDPIFPTFGTQIVRTSSSSATLQELQDIQFASFAGGVWIDISGGTAGITFPKGTERQPVNNFADGLSIAATRGFNTFYIRGDATIDSGLDYTDFVFIGQGQNLSALTVSGAATVVNCSFEQANVTGTLDGDSRLFGCTVGSLSFVSGVIEKCILAAGTITLGGSAQAQLVNCASGVPGVGTPIINMGGAGQDLTMRNYSGGIKIENKTGADLVSLDLSSGQVILDDATVTTGVIVVRGVGKLRSESGADIPTGTFNGATIVNELIEGSHIREMHKYLNLDPSDPMEFNPTDARSVSGDIDIDIAASSILPGGNRFTRQ
jgi:hypothetical protein